MKRKRYISLAEASKLCQYSQEYLSLRARQGKLKAAKRARKWVTTKEWLQEYVEKHEAFIKRQDVIRYISLSQASKLCPYSQEYLSLRARQGKLKALKKDRNWFTTREWLSEYLEKVSLKQEREKELSSVDSSIVSAVSGRMERDEPKQFRGAVAGLPRFPIFKGISAMAKKAHSLACLPLMLAGIGRSMARSARVIVSGYANYFSFKTLKSFQYEFADVARLVVIFILVGSAILFIAKPGVEVARQKVSNVGSGSREIVMRNFITPARVSLQKMPRLIGSEIYELGLIGRLAVIRALDLGQGVVMKFDRASISKAIASLRMSVQNGTKDFIATYKIGFKTIASAYNNAPENIAIKWAKVEQNNESIKIALRSNAKTSIAATDRIWQSVQHLTFNDIAYGAENLMARSGKKTFAILAKAGAGYKKLESKYSSEKAQIKEAIMSVRLAYSDRKAQTKTAFNFIKAHPEVVFEKAFSPIARMNNNLLVNFEYVKAQVFKGVSHFAANYKIGLRVIRSSYKASPQNIAIRTRSLCSRNLDSSLCSELSWQKLEEGNEAVKIGLRDEVVYGSLALKKGAQTVFADGSQKFIAELTRQAHLSAIKIADFGGQASSGIQSGLSKISFDIQEIWGASSKIASKGFNIAWKISVVPLQLSFEQAKLQNEISFSAIKSFYKYSPKVLSAFGSKTAQFSGNAANVLKSFSAAVFERSLDVAGRGAERIYSGIRSVCQTIASKLVGTYEFAIEIFRSSQKPEEIAVKEPQQQIKEIANEQKQGMVVVPSTDKDEETKKKIRDSFSDEVKVEIQDDSSGIITPVFRDKEGDRYLYMMVPISEQN